jgi:hypothetical protein
LPFISFGGSSLVTMMAGVGLLPVLLVRDGRAGRAPEDPATTFDFSRRTGAAGCILLAVAEALRDEFSIERRYACAALYRRYRRYGA